VTNENTKELGVCQPPNKQLQRTVKDKVPRQRRHHAAAELRRYADDTPRRQPG
jgi:hypothetical protein